MWYIADYKIYMYIKTQNVLDLYQYMYYLLHTLQAFQFRTCLSLINVILCVTPSYLSNF